MAEQFIGLTVLIDLKTGISVQGKVDSVDLQTQQLNLIHVTLHMYGMKQQLANYAVMGTNIKDLKILEAVAEGNGMQPQQQQPQQHASPSTSHVAKSGQNPVNRPAMESHQNGNGNTSLSSSSAGKSPSKSSKKKRGQRLPRNRFDSNNEATFSSTDAPETYGEDFDFQGNLEQFDKEQVFEEIRRDSHVAKKPAEELLVNLNLRSKMMEKIPYYQNVLDDEPPKEPRQQQQSPPDHGSRNSSNKNVRDEPFNHTTNGSTHQSNALLYPDESDDHDGDFPSTAPISGESSPHQEVSLIPYDGVQSSSTSGQKTALYLETPNQVYVPTVTPEEMYDIWSSTINDYGIPEEILIENGGRGIAMMAMQILGGSRRIRPENHNEKPLIVVLVGSSTVGAFAIAAARHLFNHECLVHVLHSDTYNDLQSHQYQPNGAGNISAMERQLRMFKNVGGVTSSSSSTSSLQGKVIDLVIDGLLDTTQSISNLTTEEERRHAYDMIAWANHQQKTSRSSSILSIDMPSGINGALGVPFLLIPHVTSRWTCAMGLPKTGHLRSARFHGQVMLIDVGIPLDLLKKQSLQRPASAKRFLYTHPFEDKYIAGLLEVTS